MSIGGAKQKITITNYFMSIHYGICDGPVDELLQIYVDEKLAAEPNADPVHNQFTLNNMSLFGGDEKEGGISGIMDYLPGTSTQEMPNYLAQKLKLTTETCPGYRGIASLFFHGGNSGSNDGLLGFLWRQNTPYLPGVWAKVRRAPKGLNPAKSMIDGDANGAHIIYECLTNKSWGMGAPTSMINTVSMEAAGDTLFDESFGLSLMWTRQKPIEDFIGEILDHIQGVIFVNPADGLITLRLIRDDYDVETLRTLTPDNCKVTKFQRKLWGETINEIVVTYTSPTNEEERTVSVQDLGNISQQGAVISDSRNYYAVRVGRIASRLANRDLSISGRPFATVEIDVNRTGWNILPGDVVKLTYPELEVTDLVLRVGPVNYGNAGAPTIKITATEDVFALPAQAFDDPPESGWEDPAVPPRPMTFVRPFTLPWFMTVDAIGVSEAKATSYPEVLIGFLTAQDDGDTISYDLHGETVLANGESIMENLGAHMVLGCGTLTNALVQEASTVIASFSDLNGPTVAALAQFVVVGDGTDSEMEFLFARSTAVGGGYTYDRGSLDTTPRAWSAGTRVWFLNPNTAYYDGRMQAAGDTVDYKMLTRTSLGILAEGSAPVLNVTPTDRHYRPLRPANVSVDGVSFGTHSVPGSGPWTVGWSNRNRLLEDSQVVAWSGANVAPEAGQTTTITVLNATTRAVLNTIDGLTGTSYSLPKSAFAGQTSGIVRVTSKRDGLESLQGHEILKTNIT